MDKLKAIIKYFCLKYPHKMDLSNARLTKMVYLADWEAAKRLHHQLTDIRWQFNHYGPYVDDVIETAKQDQELEVVYTTNIYGSPKIVVRFIGNKVPKELNKEEINILDDVLRETSPMFFNSFVKHIYSTYPIRQADRYMELDLIALASEEQEKGKTNV